MTELIRGINDVEKMLSEAAGETGWEFLMN